MTGTNHVLTGAVIGLAVANPLVAIPLAFVSHFVCDVLPHFGGDDEFIKSRLFSYVLIGEAIASNAIFLSLLVIRPDNWAIAIICGILAFIPDAIWVRKYLALKRDKPFAYNKIERVLHDIQWYEKPRGAVIELIWLGAGMFILASLML